MSRYTKHFLLVIALVIAAGVITYYMPLVKGLDIDGGIRVTLEVDPVREGDWPTEPTQQKEKLSSIRKTIQKRVMGLQGVSEPTVFVSGNNRVVVELPGVKDPEAALERVRSTAALEFYHLNKVQTTNNPVRDWELIGPQNAGDPYVFVGPNGEELNTKDDAQEILEKVVDYEKNPPILTGKDLLPTAEQVINQQNQVVIDIEFDPEGEKVFEDFTRENTFEILAIFFDGQLLTAPTVQDVIRGGRAEISGFRSLNEAKEVAEFLNAGALPVPLKVVAKDSVQPTLGKETVGQVVVAGVAGLALVCLFMLIYYRLPGLIATIALILYALFVIAVFKLIGATVSLSGLAALIISIGMAVDANILIFERLKEELHAGKTLRAAIDAGFNRAFTAILDSNVCTAITCAILMWYGTPSVQSFALTLLIGVAISMFTAITVSRTLLHLLVNIQWAQNPALFGLSTSWIANAAKKTIDIVSKRTVYFIISAILIVPGLVVLFMPGGGLKPNIEFKSGTELQVRLEKTVTAPELIAKVREANPSAEVRLAENNNAFIKTDYTRDEFEKVDGKELSTDEAEAAYNEKIDEIKELLEKTYGIYSNTEIYVEFDEAVTEGEVNQIVSNEFDNAEVALGEGARSADIYIPSERKDIEDKLTKMQGAFESGMTVRAYDVVDKPAFAETSVEPAVSEELVQNAIVAVIIASIAIILYMTFRFAIGGLLDGLKYGVCAVAALIHDAAFVVGLFAILGKLYGWEVGALFVTAVLTIAGYSVHDTIVVFDRVRENLKHRLKGESFDQLCNRSIMQTIARSINTTLTVVFTLSTLIIFGGPLLRHFYVALLAGILIGTYSSIFLATQLVVVWNKASAKNAAKGGKKDGEGKVLVDKPSTDIIGEEILAGDTPEEFAEKVKGEETEESQEPGEKKPKKPGQKKKKRRF